MKCRILHESNGRMRIHIYKGYMTGEQADILEVFVKQIPNVADVKVDERTQNAVIRYRGNRTRGALIRALSEFDYETTDIQAPEHSGRAINRKYEDKIFYLIARRVINRVFFPTPLRTIITVVKSIPYIIKGIRTLAKGKVQVPVLDAAAITVAMVRGEFDTASSVMFLLKIGDIMEDWTHQKSVADLAQAMSLNVDKVWLVTEDGEEVLTGINQVHAGDTVVVRTGNMIPLDGVVKSGDAMINQASITGEPLPVHKEEGGYIYAGTVVDEGEIQITVKSTAGAGRYDRIVAMIEESEKLKSETEDKAFHLADRLVPWTFAATGLTWLLTRSAARASSILMVDFCCALKLSMPISVLSAMREASKYNISVKGGKFIENFSEAETIVFDKTGTLTRAQPKVREVIPFNHEDPDEMLRLAACLEEHYPHSIANAVVGEAAARGLNHAEKHSKVEYIVAHGIASSVDGESVRIGSHHFIFEDEKAEILPEDQEKFDSLPDECSHLYLALNGVLSAVILIEDPIKEETQPVIRELHNLGFKNIVMMTGDSERTARAVAKLAGVDDYRAEVLPEDKAAYIRKEHEAGRKVIMVGDGVNDSPALSEADCGVAMNSGAAIAREISDITISGEDLWALVTMKRLSDSLMGRIHSNYRTIISFNSFLIFMGVIGVFPSTTTALLHNLSTILIALHSMTDLLPEEEVIEEMAPVEETDMEESVMPVVA